MEAAALAGYQHRQKYLPGGAIYTNMVAAYRMQITPKRKSGRPRSPDITEALRLEAAGLPIEGESPSFPDAEALTTSLRYFDPLNRGHLCHKALAEIWHSRQEFSALSRIHADGSSLSSLRPVRSV